MRKGRSSRRSRISRPLVSVKGEALSTDAGPSSSPMSGHASPRVVLGVPPSDPPPASAEETIEVKGPATARSSVTSTIVRGSVDREEHLPPPPSEPPLSNPVDLSKTIVDPPRVEAKADLKATVVHGSEAAAPKVEAAKVDLKATVVHGSAIEPKKEEPKEPKANFAKTLAFGSKINELPQSERIEAKKPEEPKKEEPKKEERKKALKELRATAKGAQKAISPKADPDEISVPPANDLDVESENFFVAGEQQARKSVHDFHLMVAEEAEENVDAKARRKADPNVARRREKFAGYVKIAVAGAAIVCLAAIGRSAMHSSAKPPAPAAQTIAAEATPTPPPPVTEKAAEPVAAPTPPPEAKPEEKPAEPTAAPAEAADAAAEAPTKAEEIAGDAKEELKKAKAALERSKIPLAIEAGERSVALDPTDGEAWLILGAAYQEKGDMTNARRCYTSCVKEGKTGPRMECQKMLRF
jgi:hypothetical protein